MKKIVLLISFFFITGSACVYSFLCCFNDNDQIEDFKEHLNIPKTIIIDPQVSKTGLLCRYKTRKEQDITWHAQIASNFSGCISLSLKPELIGVEDPGNYLIRYEWRIESKKPGFAELRLEQYKGDNLQRSQFVKVEVKD